MPKAPARGRKCARPAGSMPLHRAHTTRWPAVTGGASAASGRLPRPGPGPRRLRRTRRRRWQAVPPGRGPAPGRRHRAQGATIVGGPRRCAARSLRLPQMPPPATRARAAPHWQQPSTTGPGPTTGSGASGTGRRGRGVHPKAPPGRGHRACPAPCAAAVDSDPSVIIVSICTRRNSRGPPEPR